MRFLVSVGVAVVAMGCVMSAEEAAPGAKAHRDAALILIPLDWCALANPMAIKVPSQCKTVQAALDMAADGGTITLASGVYLENVVVAKKVTLAGAGTQATRIVGPNAALPTVFFAAKAGGTVQSLAISGGSEAIAAGETTLSGTLLLPGAVTLKQVLIDSTPAGVRGWFAALTLDTVTVTGPTQGGLVLKRANALSVSNSTVTASGGAGISVAAPTTLACTVAVTGSTLSNHAGAGLAVTGKSCSTMVSGGNINGNKGAGIDVTGGPGKLSVSGPSVLGNWGAGVRVSGGTGAINLASALILGNGGAGVLVTGAHVVDLGSLTVSSNGGNGIELQLSGAGRASAANVGASANGGMGLHVAGGAGPNSVWKSSFQFNHEAGISLWKTGPTQVSMVVASDTAATILQSTTSKVGAFGDGIRVWASDASVTHALLEFNARAGASIFGCGGPGATADGARLTISEDTMTCNAFSLDIETTPACSAGKPWLEDWGINACRTDTCAAAPHGWDVAYSAEVGCTTASGLDYECYKAAIAPWGACKAMSSSLDPLTVPGL